MSRYAVVALAVAAALASPAVSTADPLEPRTHQIDPYTIDLRHQADVTIDGAAATTHLGGDMAGQTVGGGGDVNGDGIDDLVIAAPAATPQRYEKHHGAGEVYVVFGRHWPSGTRMSLADIGGPLPGRLAGFRIDGRGRVHSLGIGAATIAGDVNGDGLDDVVASTPFRGYELPHGAGQPQPNAVYVIFGSTSPDTVKVSDLGERGIRITGSGAGWSGAGAADVNGDGLADVVTDASCPAGSGLHGDCAYVVFGATSPTGFDLGEIDRRGYAIGSSKPSESLPDGAAGGGDINGDGWPDVVSGFSTGDSQGAYAVFGSPSTGPIDIADPGGRGFSMGTARPGTEAGRWIAFAGDVNGDGFDDVIVSARFARPHDRLGAGAAYVVYGNASTAPVNLDELGKAGIKLEGAATSDTTGRSVDGAGDVNGDGFDDVIVGAPGAGQHGRDRSGSAYIIFGGTKRQTIDLASLGRVGVRIDGADYCDKAGTGVAGVGDINSDGFDDVLIGAQQMECWPFKPGAAYVVYGRPWAADESAPAPKSRKPLPR